MPVSISRPTDNVRLRAPVCNARTLTPDRYRGGSPLTRMAFNLTRVRRYLRPALQPWVAQSFQHFLLKKQEIEDLKRAPTLRLQDAWASDR
jgi:hypothetical protein